MSCVADGLSDANASAEFSRGKVATLGEHGTWEPEETEKEVAGS